MHFIRSLAVLSTALLPFYATAAPMLTAPSDVVRASRAGEKISDNYIVVMKGDIDEETFTIHMASTTTLHNNRLVRRDDASLTGMKKKYAFGSFKGYYGAFDSSTIEQIRNSTEVDYVEQDQIMETQALTSQKNVQSWGLARISQGGSQNGTKASKGIDFNSYFFDSSAGEGITAYVIDTGINIEHEDFEGRATFGKNFADTDNTDGVGHGTHVAGTIGGAKFGVAKKTSLVAVKVLGSDGSGTNSGVIDGVEWVTADAKSKGASAKSVANMSLGGSFSKALNDAVAAAVGSGITFCVAAGNENVDASDSSPASTASAITVGATEITDARAEYSNFGKIVDVFAPGSNITSAWIGSTSAVNTISGTSMATPHVAGLAAYLMAAEGISGSKAVTARIKALAISGVVTDPAGSPNSFVNNGSGK